MVMIEFNTSLFSGASLATFIFFLVTFFFVFFSIIVAYHWFNYGHKRSVSLLSIAIYLLAAAPLFLAMAISIRYM